MDNEKKYDDNGSIFEELYACPISSNMISNSCGNTIHVCMKPKKIEASPPVCLICVVDISSSMKANCSNNVENMESVYVSRLLLVKHSLNTIISSLRKDDMISVITFGDKAKMYINPTILENDDIKNKTIENVNNMTAAGLTNMWDGIKCAINTSKTISEKKYQKSIMVFTDGEPNINPTKGIYQALKETLDASDDKFTISTFGFGNGIIPNLLIQIANLANGIYGYCPDGTMVGTIFINFLANLLSTITSSIKITVSKGNEILKSKYIGPLYRGCYRNSILNIDNLDSLNEIKITVELPLLDKSFDVPLKDKKEVDFQKYINEMLDTQNKSINNNNDDDDDDDELLDEESDEEETITRIENVDTNAIITEKDSEPIKYEDLLLTQIIRESFITNLYQIIKIRESEEEPVQSNLLLNEFFNKLNQLKYKNKFIKGLLIDISNSDPNHGQVEKAIYSNYFKIWGKSYLLSFLRFHEFEQCGNFKDESLQCYSHEIFSYYRKMANTIFINIPPPKENDPHLLLYMSGNSASLQMSNFVNPHGGCFNGNAVVLLANNKTKLVKDLKKGDRLNNNAIIQCLIEQKSNNSFSKPYMCDINGVLFTPYHPISIHDKWYFPNDLIQSKQVDIDSWYNLILMDEENKKYEVEFQNGIKAITLGHYRTENEILKHPYFGTDAVLKDLEERDPIGYKNGYIIIKELNPRQLQFDENRYCVNYYKIQNPINDNNIINNIKNNNNYDFININ